MIVINVTKENTFIMNKSDKIYNVKLFSKDFKLGEMLFFPNTVLELENKYISDLDVYLKYYQVKFGKENYFTNDLSESFKFIVTKSGEEGILKV